MCISTANQLEAFPVGLWPAQRRHYCFDVPNYTDLTPVFQISEVMVESSFSQPSAGDRVGPTAMRHRFRHCLGIQGYLANRQASCRPWSSCITPMMSRPATLAVAQKVDIQVGS